MTLEGQIFEKIERINIAYAGQEAEIKTLSRDNAIQSKLLKETHELMLVMNAKFDALKKHEENCDKKHEKQEDWNKEHSNGHLPKWPKVLAFFTLMSGSGAAIMKWWDEFLRWMHIR